MATNDFEVDEETQSLDAQLLESDLPTGIRDALLKWVEKSKSFSVLVSGQTGTGKSTLINGIIGRKIAKEGKTLNAETVRVQQYTLNVKDVTVNIFDSPGLQDSTLNEQKYIEEIQAKCSNVDLFLYCIRMSETRFFAGCPDAIAMTRLTKALGERLWENGLIVLTFANDVIGTAKDRGDADISKSFCERNKKLTAKIKDFLQKEVNLSPEIAETIIFVPAGLIRMPYLPSIDEDTDPESPEKPAESHWLSNLWYKALRKTKLDAQPAMIKLNMHRITTKKTEYTDKKIVDTANELIQLQPQILSKKGANIGKELGGSVEQIGSTVGRDVAVITGNDIAAELTTKLAIDNGILFPVVRILEN